MTSTIQSFAILSQSQPDDPARRLVLFGFRQMGAHGLDDACTAHAFVTAFGKDFRRPLILLRTLMMELSAAATRPIRIAPWCCARMTPCEGALIAALCKSLESEGAANLLLADMLGIRDASGPLATATALAIAFADLGMPLN
ncbi:MAG: DUF6628 family protein [Pseudomonadota bacterium]